MPRYRTLARRLFNRVVRQPERIVFDFGSSTTKVRVNGHAPTHVPTCIAMHRYTQDVVGFGESATEMIGKVPPALEVIFPLQGGHVLKLGPFRQYFRALWNTVITVPEWLTFIRRPSVTVVLPAICTAAQRAFFQELVQGRHARFMSITKAEALWRRFQQKYPTLHSMFCLDIGDSTTECVVISSERIILAETIAFGTAHLAAALRTAIKTTYHAELGWQTMEELQREVLTLEKKPSRELQMVVRGRDVLTQLPTTVQVKHSEFLVEVLPVVQQFVAEVKLRCQLLPTEVLTQVLSEGMFLTGGGSQVRGIHEVLSEAFVTEVHVSRTPLDDVCLGVELPE